MSKSESLSKREQYQRMLDEEQDKTIRGLERDHLRVISETLDYSDTEVCT